MDSPNPDLARAWTLPKSIYIEPAWLAREREAIYMRTWQVVARTADLVRPADFVTADLLGEPLLISRGLDGRLRAFYNVCRHRAGSVACGKGNRKVFQCRYHGWTYALDGALLNTREFEGVEAFDPADFGLVPVRVEAWGPLVFVNLSNQGPSLGEYLAEILTETAAFKLDGLRLVERRDYEVACNWKVYVENYLEGYHIPMAHPGLYKELDYENYRVEPRRYHSRQLAPLRPAVGGSGPRRYAELEPDREVLYYWLYPNLMLNLYPDNISVNLVVPLSQDRTLTIFEWYFEDQGSAESWEAVQQGIAFSDEIQHEDIEICESVQRNLASRAYLRGRFCVKRENGVHHFQTLLAQSLVEAPHLDVQESDG